MKTGETKKLDHLKALARLGLAVGAIYAAPVLTPLAQQASASGALTIATDPLTVKECGACHIPFSPRFLRSYAWQKIMIDLGNHFGEDASLPEDQRQKIEHYLVYNASRPRNIETRISNYKWFQRAHDAKRFSASTLEKVGTFSNCAGCHQIKGG